MPSPQAKLVRRSRPYEARYAELAHRQLTVSIYDESPIQWEEYAFKLLRNQLSEKYCAQPDEEDPAQRPISQTLESADLTEYFEEDWGQQVFLQAMQPRRRIVLGSVVAAGCEAFLLEAQARFRQLGN
ncbi:hypothetical protein SAMN05216197_12613 [Pseudomonas graminis]|uniref:Uncharacterized protein n=1 Tax=Pseudomonas graminis TaxID=158627 RepID=A0A1I0H967_9PSED|nr:hypothetical protein SAMN05216197_12613 [Pseudomonas graminis]